MNFFEHQQHARSQSRRLLVAFVLAVLLTAAAIVGVLAVMISAFSDEPPHGSEWIAPLGIGAAVVIGVIALASLWRIASLARGGGALARALGAVQVSSDTQVPRLRRLRNVVEEMSIASGVPVPEIYLLEKEAGINAFAAGFSPADAAICVTSGALDTLSREELQGVIAHEFSHVLNGDMRLNLRLLGLLFGLLMLGVIGRHMMEARSGEKEGMAIAVAGIAVWLVGSLGLLCGRMIKASISRKREYLADASAVQFTRQTSGLVGALKKAAALPAGTRLRKGEGEEVAHMLFGDGVGYGALFATHPPLAERIRRLDPRFTPAELKQLGARMGQGSIASGSEEDGALGVSQLLSSAAVGVRMEPQQVAQMVGQAQDPHLAQARQIRRNLSPVLKLAARTVEHGPALLYALLLDRQDALRQRQLALIGEQQGQALVVRTQELFAVLQSEALDERLPLAQLCFPTLKRRPPTELRGVVSTVHALVHIDGAVAVFEYCLASMLEQLLKDAEAPRQSGQSGSLPLAQALQPASELLAVLAVLGSEQSSAASAYAAGASQIEGLSTRMPQLDDWRDCLDRQLPVLDRLSPLAKPQLIAALTATLLHDGLLSVEEGELLRTVCAALHCPLPPLFEHPGSSV